jgi:hypothetical protein
MGKHLELEITDERFGFHRKHEQIEREAALDVIYVLRTRNTIRVVGTNATFDKLAKPNALQRRALELIERA